MPSSELRGPFSLTGVGIDSAVKATSAGAYALGKTDVSGTFHIHYIGRADSDVCSRLKDHVAKWYPEFKYEYYPSARAAFDKECNLYHDFNPPDNQVHPACSPYTNWRCPRCNA
jgi:hypothetical protein